MPTRTSQKFHQIRAPSTVASNLEEVAYHLYGRDVERPKVSAISELVRRHVVEHEEEFDFKNERQIIYIG